MAFYISFMANGEGNNSGVIRGAEATDFASAEVPRGADASETRTGVNGRFGRFMTAVTVGLALASCAPDSQKTERDSNLSSLGKVGFSSDTVSRTMYFYGSTVGGGPAEVNIRISQADGEPKEYALEVPGQYTEPIPLAGLGEITEILLYDDNGFEARAPQDQIADLNGKPSPAEWGTIPERP